MQEAEQILNRINAKIFITRHIIIKIMKTKDKEISWKQQERNETLNWEDVANNSIGNNTLTDLNHTDKRDKLK